MTTYVVYIRPREWIQIIYTHGSLVVSEHIQHKEFSPGRRSCNLPFCLGHCSSGVLGVEKEVDV